jgi:hypothetical protein
MSHLLWKTATVRLSASSEGKPLVTQINVHRVASTPAHALVKKARRLRIQLPMTETIRDARAADFAAARGWDLSPEERIDRFRAAGLEY